MPVASFEMNPFSENSYIIYDNAGICAIVDPGCSDAEEQNILVDFIKTNQLTPQWLLNTHCHIDHIWGNAFTADRWNLLPQFHKEELPVWEACASVAAMYGLPPVDPGPAPLNYLTDHQILQIGALEVEVIFVPGHSPGHVAFYCAKEHWLMNGDVLFYGSIGRTDLPGGDHTQLLNSIRTRLWPLPEDTVVYTGHGQETYIGFEKRYNPFLRE